MIISAILAFVWLVFYIAPFALIIASWNGRSFFIITAIVFILIAYNWISHTNVSSAKQADWGWGINDVLLQTACAGFAVGTAARGITLAKGWQRFERASIMTYFIGLVIPVAFAAISLAYDKWM